MKKKQYWGLAILILIIILPYSILLVSLDSTYNWAERKNGLYNVINKDTSLGLDRTSAEIIRHFEYGFRDRIYIVELNVSALYRMELQKRIQESGTWAHVLEVSTQEIQQFVLNYLDEFDQLERIASICKDENTYISIQVFENNKYSLEFSVTAYDMESGDLFYFRMQT